MKTNKEKMKISSGIIIRWKESIFLCHPTNSSWTESYSFPKGGVEDGEELMDAAIRECFEETGVKINKNQIVCDYCVSYQKKSNTFKKVYLYQVNIDSLSEIGLTSPVIEKSKLQLEEVDWAGFVNKENIQEKLFWRFREIVDKILE